jgi:hypothetical protein
MSPPRGSKTLKFEQKSTREVCASIGCPFVAKNKTRSADLFETSAHRGCAARPFGWSALWVFSFRNGSNVEFGDRYYWSGNHMFTTTHRVRPQRCRHAAADAALLYRIARKLN